MFSLPLQGYHSPLQFQINGIHTRENTLIGET